MRTVGLQLAIAGFLALAATEARAQCTATNICVGTSGFNYVFDTGSGYGANNPPLTLNAGTTYSFVVDSGVPAIHPFGLEDSNGSNAGSTKYPANPGETTVWTPTAGSYQYQCTVHLFGNTITVVGPDSGTVVDSGSPGTDSGSPGMDSGSPGGGNDSGTGSPGPDAGSGGGSSSGCGCGGGGSAVAGLALLGMALALALRRGAVRLRR